MMATPPLSLARRSLQFLFVVIAGALLDLGADFLDAAFDITLLAFAADDGGVLFVRDNLLGAAEVLKRGGLELAAGLFRDHRTTGEDGNILQHGLAAVTKARGFDGQHVQHAAQFVQDEGGESFAVDIFGDDDEFALANLDEFFEKWERYPAQQRSSSR